MSGFAAIAGVSSTLRTLLRDRMENPVDITIAPPDVTILSMNGQRANLYLFKVTKNAHLSNQEIPGEGHPAAYGSPPLALDLGYLVTAHGASANGEDADLQAQQTLGDVMRVFHEFPIVTEDLHENDNLADPPVLDASLIGEFERVKITLEPSGIDELSKIWTAMPETAFRRAVTYSVSVVQIESQRRRITPRPVRRRGVYAFPLQTPYIEEVFREPMLENVRTPVAEVGDTLVIRGRNLAGLSTQVRIGDQVVNIPAPQPRRIELAVPAGVTAGTHSLQVIHDLPLEAEAGQPPVLHRGFASNVVPVLVLPAFQAAAPDPIGAGAVVTVTVAPAVEAAQTRTLLLGDIEITGQPVAVDSPPAAAIDFRLPANAQAITPGNHLARVRIDGAESRLTVDANGHFDGPMLGVT